MKGIFVNENGCIPYAHAIVKGAKTIETRNRNMLSGCIGDRVAVVRTRRGKNPLVVGYVDIIAASFCPLCEFKYHFDQHLVPPGSMYDAKARGKWFYWLENPEECEAYPLPADAVRHGRSWCEF